MKYVVNAGALDEIDHKKGIAHFTEHMLFKGTVKRTAEDINNDIAYQSGNTNAYTSFDEIAFYISSPSDKWKENFEILNDIFWHSTIPENELAKEKTVIIEELKMYDDKPKSRCLEQLEIMINTNADNRQRVAGTVESVKDIYSEDIKRFMKCFFIPSNVLLIAAGNIDEHQFIQTVDEYVKDIDRGISQNRNLHYDNDILNNRLILLEKNDISQAHLAFAIKGVHPSHKAYAVQELIADILGGGFTSRLYNIIREQKGLAYTVRVHANPLRDTSYIFGYVGLDANNLDEVHKIIVQQLNRLKKELVEDKELEVLKNVNYGQILLANESTASRASIHEDNFIYNTNYTLDDIIQNMKNVTPEQIMTFAKKYFTKENIAWSIVKPKGI